MCYPAGVSRVAKMGGLMLVSRPLVSKILVVVLLRARMGSQLRIPTKST